MKVVYIGCDEHQKSFGNNTGDTDKLEAGKMYEVQEVEVHSWHTKYYLEGIEGSFNSVCFDQLTDDRGVDRICTWQEDENGLWWTDCKEIHEFFDGTPTENHYKFCPYCGKRIEEVKYEA